MITGLWTRAWFPIRRCSEMHQWEALLICVCQGAVRKCRRHHLVRMVGMRHLSPRGTAEVYPGRLGSPGPDVKSGSVGRGQDAQLHDEEASLALR